MRKEMIKLLDTNEKTLKKWKDGGLIRIHAYGAGYQRILYEPPADKDLFAKIKENVS